MKRKALFVLVGMVCCVALAAAAAAGIWRTMGPYGDMTYDLIMAPEDPDVLFVACNGGLFKSVNGGASWENARKDYSLYALSSVSAARAGRDLVIANNTGYVYLSLDGGASWQQIVGEPLFTGVQINSVAIDPRNPEVVWVCTNNGPCRSISSGTGWVLRNNGLPANFNAGFVRFDVADASGARLYLCGKPGSAKGIYISYNSGVAWEPFASEQAQSVDITDLALDPEDPQTLYAATYDFGVLKTVDGGTSWAAKNAGLSKTEVYHMAISSSEPDVLYCNANDQLYVSEDGAESWQQRDEGANVGYQASSLIVSPLSSDAAYVGTQFGVYKTVDRGVSWRPTNQGIAGASVTNMVFDSKHLGTIFVATEMGFFRTRDNGQSWDLLSMEGKATNASHVKAIALDPQEPSTVYAASDWENRARIMKSVDGGDAWVELYNLEALFNVLAIDPSDPRTMYLAGNGKLFKSQDGGYTWALAMSGVQHPDQIRALAIDPKDPSVLWLGSWTLHGGFTYRSQDGASSWEQVIARGGNDVAISPVEPDTVYIADGYGLVIARSDGSGGYTFQEDQPGLLDDAVNSIDISPGNPDVVYLGTGAPGLTSLFAGVYKTTNGGQSWAQLPCEGMVGKPCVYVAADPYIPNEVWAGFNANALLKYSEEPGLPIQMSLSTNQNQYAAGDIHVARISATNSGGDINVDLYIAIMLPDSSLLFWPDFSPLMHPGFSMTPMPRGFSMTDVVFFSMTLPGSLPGGNYTWFGMFYAQATNNPASNLASAGWTLLP